MIQQLTFDPRLPRPADPGTDRPETCRATAPVYGGNGELVSPRLGVLGGSLGMEGELVSPLLMAPVHIDPSCLHPDLLTEVQHVVIAREHLLLHLNQVIGRGQKTKNTFTLIFIPEPSRFLLRRNQRAAKTQM